MSTRPPSSSPSGGHRAHRPVAGWSAAYLTLGVVGSVVAVFGSHPGAPFGIGPGFSSAQGVVVGWGSAVSAPWPLLVWLGLSGVLGRGPRWSVPTLGTLFLVGALAEPVWDLAAGSEGVLLAGLVWANLLVPIGLVLAWARTNTGKSSRNDPVTTA